jgi:hypothetical protein
MSSEKRSVKRLIVPSPVPDEPGVASVTCGTVSPPAATSARPRGTISASLILPAWRFASARHPCRMPCLPGLTRNAILLETGA